MKQPTPKADALRRLREGAATPGDKPKVSNDELRKRVKATEKAVDEAFRKKDAKKAARKAGKGRKGAKTPAKAKPARKPRQKAKERPSAPTTPKARPEAATAQAPTAADAPPQSKPALLKAFLQDPAGRNSAEIEQEFGWEPHTARAAVSRLGKTETIVATKVADRGTVYTIPA